MMAKKQGSGEPSDPGARASAPPIWVRVRTIRRQMERGAWGAEAAAALAVEWGITEAMVRGHAAEASRQIEAVIEALGGADGALRQICADLELGLQMAIEQEDPFAVRGLLEVKAKLHGIGVHRDSRNDPKPEPQPQAGKVLPWRKKA